ncbi:MAG TPA: hypothetical protein VM406_16515 [Noviherbaspirillum sp.]|nr:hypothetical protein [Noviherbaspirillum sp.]
MRSRDVIEGGAPPDRTRPEQCDQRSPKKDRMKRMTTIRPMM